MNWNNASEFFAMGGYGLYVWGSYGLVTLWMLLEPVLTQRRLQHALHQAANSTTNPTPQDA
jgi:heme exporter protein D